MLSLRLRLGTLSTAARVPTGLRALSNSATKSYEFDLPEPWTTHRLDQPPSQKVTATGKELLDMFYAMTSMRRMEAAADALYKAKLIRGFCHLCTGQEAVPVGMEASIHRDDSIITAYRCHGFTQIRGGSIMSILAELLGRRDGIAKGKGGSMHMFTHEFYGGNGIVGAQVPVGAGIAFAHKYRNTGRVCFALYGDGAANQGQIFEAYNMAKLWNLPCIFVCENNHYGMGTAATRAAASVQYFSRGDFVPGIKVNGMDVLAVREAVRFSREYALSGKGPLVLEMVTYRYGGHSMSDPGTTYRTREEIQHMRSTKDTITGLKNRILSVEAATEDELKELEKKARQEVDDAVAQAKASSEPDVNELWTNIFAHEQPSYIRGVTLETSYST